MTFTLITILVLIGDFKKIVPVSLFLYLTAHLPSIHLILVVVDTKKKHSSISGKIFPKSTTKLKLNPDRHGNCFSMYNSLLFCVYCYFVDVLYYCCA